MERPKCRKCGSANIDIETETTSGEHGEGYVTEYWMCLDCGYRECKGCEYA